MAVQCRQYMVKLVARCKECYNSSYSITYTYTSSGLYNNFVPKKSAGFIVLIVTVKKKKTK